MKNHIKVNGRHLQTNKKWSHLKQRQQSWIADATKEEYLRFIEEYKTQPRKKNKDIVIGRVYDRICEREIWIPYDEAENHIGKLIDRQNRRHNLSVSESGEVTIVNTPKAPANEKPKVPQIKFRDLPDEIKGMFADKMKLEIGLYINQTGKVPSNKIRDSRIKALLDDFNCRQQKVVGYKAAHDETIVAAYDRIRDELHSDFVRNGRLTLDTKKERLRKSLTIIETERLIIRKLDMSDLKEVSRTIGDIEVMYAWERAFTTEREVQDWIIRQRRRYKDEQVGYFLAVEKRNGQVVGQVGLMWNEINGENLLEVGYILNKEYWHKGYASEGARACLRYGFELFDVVDIYATIRPENAASIAVAERIGMKYAGTCNKVFDDKSMKHSIYRISRNELAL